MQRKQSQKRQFQQHRQQAGYTHPAIMTLNNWDTDDQGLPEAIATTSRHSIATTGGVGVRGEDIGADISDIRGEDEDDDESGEAAADDVALLDCVAHAQANVTIRESSDCVYQQRHHQPQHQHHHQPQHQHQQHCQDKLVNLQMGGDVGFRKTTWHAPSANAAAGHSAAAAAAAAAAMASGSTGKDAMKAMKNVGNDERA